MALVRLHGRQEPPTITLVTLSRAMDLSAGLLGLAIRLVEQRASFSRRAANVWTGVPQSYLRAKFHAFIVTPPANQIEVFIPR